MVGDKTVILVSNIGVTACPRLNLWMVPFAHVALEQILSYILVAFMGVLFSGLYYVLLASIASSAQVPQAVTSTDS